MLSPESNRMVCWEKISSVLPASTLLAMRLGDFFEFYQSDAKAVCAIFKVALTKRNSVPMCGLPYHQEATMFSSLTHEGFNVALAEKGSDGDWCLVRLARSSSPRSRNYEVPVTETRIYKRTYTVEATSPEEATEKAERGETVDETEGTLTEITDREVVSPPKLCP